MASILEDSCRSLVHLDDEYLEKLEKFSKIGQRIVAFEFTLPNVVEIGQSIQQRMSYSQPICSTSSGRNLKKLSKLSHIILPYLFSKGACELNYNFSGTRDFSQHILTDISSFGHFKMAKIPKKLTLFFSCFRHMGPYQLRNPFYSNLKYVICFLVRQLGPRRWRVKAQNVIVRYLLLEHCKTGSSKFTCDGRR